MSEKIELKPFPFCGKSAYLSDVSDCIGCVGTCPIAGDAMTLEDWNNRPIEDAQAARIAELERLVDDLRGELAQAARIAELEEALNKIAKSEAGSHEPPSNMAGCMCSEACMTCEELIAIARKALEESK